MDKSIEVQAREFARDIRDNYDHDEDPHRYGNADTQCRRCLAETFLSRLDKLIVRPKSDKLGWRCTFLRPRK
jgi:hypothetical protein